tara:strand:- start:474 stop:710 length:237 start_codon:yes stop_codon:yes gene_type:complete
MAILKQGWTLVNKETKDDVNIKDLIKTFREEEWILEGGIPPHKPSSTGRVWVSSVGNPNWNREFYPSVFNMKWIENNT